MRFSSLIVTALAAVCVIANPLPSGLASDGVVEVKKVSDGDLSTMVTDHIPTTEELKKHMHTQAEMKNTSLFYSGPHGYRPKALELAKKIGRHILTDFFLDPYYAASWPDNNTEFWNHASEAMAQLSSETVYVLLPSDTVGQVWYPNTFWDRIEWPTLIKNPAVDYVVRVNPDNDKHEVIYQAHRY